MTKLPDTQRVILSKAAQHDALLANPPAKLPVAARQAVLRSIIAKGLLQDVPAPREAIGLGWRQAETTHLGVVEPHGLGARRGLTGEGVGQFLHGSLRVSRTPAPQRRNSAEPDRVRDFQRLPETPTQSNQ